MLKNLHYFYLCLAVLFVCSCAPSRIVKPLKKGEDRWGASLGGALMKKAGGAVPIPFTTISYAKAKTDSLTWFTAIHSTSALYNNFQFEIGFCYNVYQNKKFRLFKDSVNLGVSITPVANYMMHVNGKKYIETEIYKINNTGQQFFSGVKLWPQLDVNVHIAYGKKDRHFFYIGLCNWFELNSPYGYNPLKKPSFIMCSPQIGNTWSDKKGLWSLTVEAKYLVPYLKGPGKDFASYVRPGNTGAIGLFFGITKKIVRPEYDDN